MQLLVGRLRGAGLAPHLPAQRAEIGEGAAGGASSRDPHQILIEPGHRLRIEIDFPYQHGPLSRDRAVASLDTLHDARLQQPASVDDGPVGGGHLQWRGEHGALAHGEVHQVPSQPRRGQVPTARIEP